MFHCSMLHTSNRVGGGAYKQAQEKQQQKKLEACKNEDIFKKLFTAAWESIKNLEYVACLSCMSACVVTATLMFVFLLCVRFLLVYAHQKLKTLYNTVNKNVSSYNGTSEV